MKAKNLKLYDPYERTMKEPKVRKRHIPQDPENKIMLKKLRKPGIKDQIWPFPEMSSNMTFDNRKKKKAKMRHGQY